MKHATPCLRQTRTGMRFHRYVPELSLFSAVASLNIASVQTGDANLGRPFLNEAIIGILKEEYFDGRKSLYKLYPQEFKQTLTAEDGGKGLEIPPKLVALVSTFVRFTVYPCAFGD